MQVSNHRDSRITEIPVARSTKDYTHEGTTNEQETCAIMAYDHKGLVSFWVDHHEIGDLGARTNFLVPFTT